MGLSNSEVTAQTTEVLLESAFFNPSHVRRASRRLGLISESSYRFERGADWDMVERAALRALQLLQEHAGARIVPDWADRHDPDHRPADPLRLRVWQVNRVLGTSVTTDQVAQILQRLGLKVQPMGNAESISASAVNMMVHVPTHRRDLALEIDLIEEIARIHGLDQLTGRGGYRVPGGAVKRPRDVARERLCAWLSACGYVEIVTSSFMDAGDHDHLGLPADDPRRRTLAVLNPRHGGDTQLRTVLAPSALVVARRNLNAGATPPLRFFQINRVFRPDLPLARPTRHTDETLLPTEPEYLQLVVAGWRETGLGGVPADLLELRGAVETVSAHLRVPLTLEPGTDEAWLDAGAAWKVLDGAGRTVGTAGRVAPGVLAAFDVDAPVALAEIRLDDLDLTPAPAHFEPFTRFPAVKRDLSLLVPAAVAFGRVLETVTEVGGPWLESSELFDIYRGKGVPEGLAAFGIRKLRDVNKDRDPYALDVLAAVLDGHDASRFAKNLVRGSRVAQSAGAGYDGTLRGEASFTLDGQPAEGKTIADLEAALRAEIKRIQDEGVSAEELARVKTQSIAAQIYKRDSLMAQAMEIGGAEAAGVSWRDIDLLLEKLKSVTAEEVQAVAKKYFSDDTLSIAVLDPQPVENSKPKKPSGAARH
jgi:phenylalanyl-tRNA synthetase beta subunit